MPPTNISKREITRLSSSFNAKEAWEILNKAYGEQKIVELATPAEKKRQRERMTEIEKEEEEYYSTLFA